MSVSMELFKDVFTVIAKDEDEKLTECHCDKKIDPPAKAYLGFGDMAFDRDCICWHDIAAPLLAIIYFNPKQVEKLVKIEKILQQK